MTNRAFRVSCIEGDGIGPEVFGAARSVLDTLSECYGLKFEFLPAPVGDLALKKTGSALPKESFNTVKESDVCLKAPVGESAKDTILKIRQELDLYANVRPAKNYSFIQSKFSGVNLAIVRENTEDLYVGREVEEEDGKKATALKVVTEKASKRIARYAFELALARSANDGSSEKGVARATGVVCVNKSNILKKTDGLFVQSCASVAKEFPSVNFSTMYVDTAAMNLVRNPEAFDVIVTSNMYGDILSDEASQIVGGLGFAPSANIGNGFALFEPVHGCAPDIEGKGVANPLAMIFTVKMMLDYLAATKKDKNCKVASGALEISVSSASSSGAKTPDIGGKASTVQVAEAICGELRAMRAAYNDESIVRNESKEGVLLKW
ncbi:MAG: isocitrate/isopropylmalate dehydrogenase family protein [Nitrososphaerales archaeon]